MQVIGYVNPLVYILVYFWSSTELFTVLHSVSLTKIMFVRECGKVIIICDLVYTLLSTDVMYNLYYCQAEFKFPTYMRWTDKLMDDNTEYWKRKHSGELSLEEAVCVDISKNT